MAAYSREHEAAPVKETAVDWRQSEASEARLRQIAAMRKAEARIAARKRADAEAAAAAAAMDQEVRPGAIALGARSSSKKFLEFEPRSYEQDVVPDARHDQQTRQRAVQLTFAGDKAELKEMLLDAKRRLEEALELNHRMKQENDMAAAQALRAMTSATPQFSPAPRLSELIKSGLM